MDWERVYKDLLANLQIVESPWKFDTSTGMEASVGTPIARIAYAAAGGAFWVRQGKTGPRVRLTYAAIGAALTVNLVPSLVNASFSVPDMPSAGVIYKLPCAGKALSLNEMKGAFMMIELAGDWSVGGAVGLMFLGGNYQLAAAAGPLSSLVLIASSKACVRFGGVGVTVLPLNLGLNSYIGTIH